MSFDLVSLDLLDACADAGEQRATKALSAVTRTLGK